MNCDYNKLKEYSRLVKETAIVEAYQEFIKLFKYIRTEVSKSNKEHRVSMIVENRMDFAYFQLTNKELKEKGCKVQVVYIHKEGIFEVWVSGYNRKIQEEYYQILKELDWKYKLNHHPSRIDYIYKVQLQESMIRDVDVLIEEINDKIKEVIEELKVVER